MIKHLYGYEIDQLIPCPKGDDDPSNYAITKQLVKHKQKRSERSTNNYYGNIKHHAFQTTQHHKAPSIKPLASTSKNYLYRPPPRRRSPPPP